MNQKKITICKLIFFFNVVILASISVTYKEILQESDYKAIAMGIAFLSVFTPLGIAIKESKCPTCKGYLSYKKDWIGKHCKHCGNYVEEKKYKEKS